MRALSISLKDIQLALKDPGTWINLFVLPLLFIFLFGGGLNALAGGAGEEEESARITLPFVNEDGDGALAQALLNRLEAAGSVVLAPLDAATAEADLESGDIRHVLMIPDRFSADFSAGTAATLRLVNHPFADVNETEALRLTVDAAAQDLALEEQLVASLAQMGAMQPAASPAFTTERIVAQAQTQFDRAQERPLVGVTQIDPGATALADEEVAFDRVQIAVPGFAVLFIFLTAQTTARAIYDEKKAGSFRRLLAAPISKSGLLLGKMVPNFIMALIQYLVIFIAALVILPLVGLDRLALGDDLLALALLCLLVMVCSTCLGILIAAIARTENQIGGLSTLVIWGMGILGGAFMPAFLLSDVLDTVAKVVPQYWAIDGFYRLFVLGGGLPEVAPALLALALFSALFFGVGLWRFEFD